MTNPSTTHLPDAMDRVLQPTADAINYKTCVKCKKHINNTHSLHKTCSLCRAKDKVYREQLRLKTKRMQTIAVLTHTDVRDRTSDSAVPSPKGRQENASITHRDESRKVVAGVKRKAEKSLYELEGEERNVHLKMIKSSLKKNIQRHGKKPLPSISNLKSVEKGQEYQNASLLYDALKSKALSSYPASKDKNQFLQFHGSHTIVAVSSIDNAKRLALVSNDLRKIVHLSFELHAVTSSGPSGSLTLSYPCSCVGHSQAVALPDVEKSSKPGSLIQWARAKFVSSTSQAVPRMCGGKVNVTVLNDKTHFLKISGQQIIVRVEHPNVQ